MVTGDHPLTAEAIARKVNIITGSTRRDVALDVGCAEEEVPFSDPRVEAVVLSGSQARAPAPPVDAPPVSCAMAHADPSRLRSCFLAAAQRAHAGRVGRGAFEGGGRVRPHVAAAEADDRRALPAPRRGGGGDGRRRERQPGAEARADRRGDGRRGGVRRREGGARAAAPALLVLRHASTHAHQLTALRLLRRPRT